MAEMRIDSIHSQDEPYAEGQQYPAEHQYSAYQHYSAEQQYPAVEYGQGYFTPSKTDPGNSKGTETQCPECSMTFPRSTELERHHKTVHLNNGVRPYQCLVPGCPANVRSWTTMRGLRLHDKNWHGPHSCSVPGCSRRHPFGFSSEADLEIHQAEHSGDSNLDQHVDERRRGEKEKGRSGKSADTIDENDRFAAEQYPLGGAQPPFQASSQQESNFLHYGQLYQSIYGGVYGSTSSRNIGEANTSRDRDKLGKFTKDFVVHHSREFYFGRVFKVLWSEPVGTGGTEITADFPHSESAFHKVRRFLIVSERNKGHSICIPILTYGNQGVLKRGVHPEDHAVIYSSKSKGPYVLEREKGLMTKHPIRVELFKESQKLDPLSRLNYAKLYTVEHNVKVFFIGRVAKNYERDVMNGYNEAHPPFSNAGPGLHQGSHEDLTRGAEADDPHYPLAEEDDPQGSFAATLTITPYGPSYFGAGVSASMEQPSSSQTAQAAEHPAYDDGYD
ncbi:hypothetical protein NA56DRAFT_71340 [Hyaloscypha hepaticicola]|uniref:C2H2-type domain-containing protein n=1 Tax=Hyaloscypha hepaticicola TaxID=2082293 RepID=A0A2J6QAZ2_9HELO|nr:hypothetical protein NA56DRAFT_71340 [Hyaloscypha hepaticicola]